MSEMNNRSTYDFAAALRGEELKEVERSSPGPDRPSYDFAAALRGEGLKETGRLTPLQEWNQLPDDQRNVNLGEWYKKFQTGEPVEDWQRQALKDFNVWVGDNHPLAGPEINTEPEEDEVEEKAKNIMTDWLKAVDWKNMAKEGALILGPAIFSGVLWETMPQLHQALEYFVGGGMVGGFLTEGLIGALSQAESIHPRFAGFARAVAAKRGTGLLIAQISASAGIGIVGAEGLDRWLQIQTHAVQPAAAGGGEGFSNPHPGHKPVDASGQVGVSPEDGGAGAIINPPAELPGQVGNLPGSGESGALPPGELGQPPQLPEIDVQKIVDSLPKHVGVAQLPENQQLGASHWRLAEAWSKPLANTFGLSDSARTFFTDAVKDLTQDQGNVRMDTIVNYDKRQIGDYLAEAVARLKETNPAGWQVKVPKDDLERLTKIAEFLKNSK